MAEQGRPTMSTIIHAAPRVRGRRFLLALGAVALIGFGARAWFATYIVPHTPLAGDPRTYHLLGTNLAEGLGYVRPAEVNLPEAAMLPTAEFPPGMATIVAVATKLGAESPPRQALLTALLGAGTVVAIGLLGRRLSGDSVGLIAAGIAAVHPLFVQPDAVLMSEGPYLFVVSVILLAAFSTADDPGRWWRWSLLGALIGSATLIRPEAVLFAALLVAPLATARRRGVRSISRALLCSGSALLVVVMPWSLRNATTFHRFVPVASNAGVAVVGANCPEVYSGREIGSWSFACVAVTASLEPDRSRISADGLSEVDVYSNWLHDGLTYARNHLSRLPLVVPARLARTIGVWNPNAQLDFDVPEGRNRTAQTAGLMIHLVLLPLAIAGGVASWRRRRALTAIVLVPILIALVDSAVLYGSTKMRAVAEPSLAVLAAIGLVATFTALRGRLGRAEGRMG